MESDIIKEKWIYMKDFVDMQLHKNNSYLFYILGITTGILFMLGFLAYEITGGIIGFVFGIAIFELFKYLYGDVPDIIVSGIDDEEQIAKALTNSIKKALAEAEEEDSNS
ncbi:MAG: hypothetical protein U5K53_08745 [Halanaerobiales bacterium]|nr:hypothetical protein [Halanaerobiales bacterium]